MCQEHYDKNFITIYYRMEGFQNQFSSISIKKNLILNVDYISVFVRRLENFRLMEVTIFNIYFGLQ